MIFETIITSTAIQVIAGLCVIVGLCWLACKVMAAAIDDGNDRRDD